MTLVQLLALLGENTEAKAFVNNMVSESEAGKESYRKKDKSALKYKKALQAIGYKAEDGKTVEDFVASVNESLTSIEDNRSETDKLRDELNGVTSSLAESAETNDKLKITTRLSESMGDDFLGKRLIINELIDEKKVKVVGGKVVWAGKDEESNVDFDEGFKGVSTSYEEHLVSKQKGGGGTDDDDPTNNTSLDDITLEDMGL